METTVLKAKNNLSELLRRAERGEEILIRRGVRGSLFKIVPVPAQKGRSLEPNPEWVEAIRFRDEDIWASEWKDEE